MIPGRPQDPPDPIPALTRRAYLWRASLWLAFLIIALLAPVIYLLDLPHAMAMGAVFGWGAIAGMVVAIAVTVAYVPVLAQRGRAPALATAFGMVVTGAFGGAGVAALVDGVSPVAAMQVELPVVAVVSQRGPRSPAPTIETLRALAPARPDRIPAETIARPSGTIGACLTATLMTGRLGGRWLDDWGTRSCSPKRGVPARQVLVVGDDVAGWRWHRPRLVPGGSARSERDAALPIALRCVRQREGWLLRCRPMARDRQTVAREPTKKGGPAGPPFGFDDRLDQKSLRYCSLPMKPSLVTFDRLITARMRSTTS